MIEALSQAPISSITTAGLNSFVSVLKNHPSTAFSKSEGRFPRSYVATRGILINKEHLRSKVIDLSMGYQFQFNPQSVSDSKAVNYETRGYTGLNYNDYIWGGGGERIISFQLFLDNTPQSKQRYFRPEAYGSKVAHEFKTKGDSFSSKARKSGLAKMFEGVVDEFDSQVRSFKNSIAPEKGPSDFEFTENGAYSLSRVHKRGILPEVELIQSFLYPAPLGGEKTPLFAEGGVVSNAQFRPPATVVLTLGPLYLEGVIKSAPVNYTLFDQDLTPIRGTMDIEFAAFEFANVHRRIGGRGR